VACGHIKGITCAECAEPILRGAQQPERVIYGTPDTMKLIEALTAERDALRVQLREMTGRRDGCAVAQVEAVTRAERAEAEVERLRELIEGTEG